MNVVLIMVRDTGERRSFAVTRDVTVIGRREDADFRIPLTDVSRKHCRLTVDGSALILEDLGSSNGTLHNGKRIKECEVEPGDTIQIGPVKFVVQIDGVPSDEEAKPRTPRTAVPSGSTSGRSLTPPSAAPKFDTPIYDDTDDIGTGALGTSEPASDSIFDLDPPGSSKPD